MKTGKRESKFFWVDMEMTGLDENKDSILEIAIIITDIDFNPLEEFERVVYQPPAVLDAMNDWCKKHHGKSGLTEAVKDGRPLVEVDMEILGLIEKNYPKNKKIVLAGNSVSNDQRFILKYMPKMASRLHYRVIDVSSLKEIFRKKWKIEVKKQKTHRAIDDIRESIKELKTYLQYIKIPKD